MEEQKDPGIRLEPLTSENLPQFRQLLGSADFGGCFCAVWTSHSDDWGKRCADPQQPNFAITSKDVIEKNRKPGYFVYSDNTLVGWTGSGPKTEFPFLKTKLASRLTESTPENWSIGCIALLAAYRGKNLSEKIVQALTKEAGQKGAAKLEAYPTRKFDELRVFRGTYSLYKRLGFQEHAAEKDGDNEIVLMELRL